MGAIPCGIYHLIFAAQYIFVVKGGIGDDEIELLPKHHMQKVAKIDGDILVVRLCVDSSILDEAFLHLYGVDVCLFEISCYQQRENPRTSPHIQHLPADGKLRDEVVQKDGVAIVAVAKKRLVDNHTPPLFAIILPKKGLA